MLSDRHPRYRDSHIKVDFVQPVLIDGYNALMAILVVKGTTLGMTFSLAYEYRKIFYIL